MVNIPEEPTGDDHRRKSSRIYLFPCYLGFTLSVTGLSLDYEEPVYYRIFIVFGVIFYVETVPGLETTRGRG